MTSPYSYNFTSFVFSSGDNLKDSLISGTRWLGNDVSFSFPGFSSYWSTSSSTGYGGARDAQEPFSKAYEPLTLLEQNSFISAVQKWSSVANINFTQVADNASVAGDIRVAYTWLASENDAQAWTYRPSSTSYAGDIWINAYGSSYYSNWTPGSYAYSTILHELGHALGLKHPFAASQDSDAVLPTSWDSGSFTVMSYRAGVGMDDTFFSYEPTTPMTLDIRAIQYIYGANNSYQRGNNVYTYFDGASYHETIWDAGGVDTIAYAGTQAAFIDLREGYGSQLGAPIYVQQIDAKGVTQNVFSIKNVWIAYGAKIENAVGGDGDDTITGNDFPNLLTGGRGSDVMDGQGGLDTAVIASSLAASSLRRVGGVVSVTTTFAGNTSTDTLISIERVQFTDLSLAFDLDGNAGKVAKLLGAVFGESAVSNTKYAGIGLSLLDAGFSYESVAAQALAVARASSADAALRLLWSNVVKTAPTQADLAPYASLLSNGMSAAKLAVLAAESLPNQLNIHLTGLEQSGLAYLPA